MLENIALLVLDVDGVLTDGTFYLSNDGKETKCFHTQDGQGLKNLMETGVTVAIISSRKSHAVTLRMRELGIEHVYQGEKNKLSAFENLIATLNISAENTAYMGDDLPDLPVMQKVGLAIAPANAVDVVKQIANWITQRQGGNAAVREVCDTLIAAKEKST